MSDKDTKALKAANLRISTLVWKLHRAIENARGQDIPFTEVDGVSKLAADSFKFFLEYGVLDENAHLHKPKHSSPRPHSAIPDRRQNVRTTPGSEFCDDMKVTLNFEDDQTQRKDNSLQSDLEYLKKTLRRTEIDLKSVKDENIALRHANECNTKMIKEIQNRAEEEKKGANDVILHYKEEQQRHKKAKDENNAKIATLMTERDVTNTKIAKLTTERDDTNRRLAKLITERDESRSDAAELKVVKNELFSRLFKEISKSNAGRHYEDALNKQLHEKDMECKKSKQIVENLNRKLNEIQSRQKEFLKPRLSVAAEKHMEDEKPFIGNLCYINRPTSLADKFCNVASQHQSHTSASAATVIKRPEVEKLPKLYRLLRENEIIGNGLVAKDPNGHLSVAEHVANGSGGGKSRYISTCSSLGAAQHLRYLKTRNRCRYRNGRKDIVEIDVATLPMTVEIIDLRTKINRARHELQNKMVINERFHKFASDHSEVLLVGKVPPECLTLLEG